jgi:hypothetical protein
MLPSVSIVEFTMITLKQFALATTIKPKGFFLLGMDFTLLKWWSDFRVRAIHPEIYERIVNNKKNWENVKKPLDKWLPVMYNKYRKKEMR